jgi:ribosome maturation factor RimP
MKNQEVLPELEALLSGYLQAQGIDLVELVCRYEGGRLVLRILADRPYGGIKLDECARLNQAIGNLLEEKDIIKERYSLEVASPGVDRPMKTVKDFLRCIDRPVRFALNEPIGEKIEVVGIIKQAREGAVLIEVEAGTMEIPLTKIHWAKQILD